MTGYFLTYGRSGEPWRLWYGRSRRHVAAVTEDEARALLLGQVHPALLDWALQQ